jgi:hypothetical protein
MGYRRSRFGCRSLVAVLGVALVAAGPVAAAPAAGAAPGTVRGVVRLRFLDDVRAWPSVEPAMDFTSTGMLAFALAATTR